MDLRCYPMSCSTIADHGLSRRARMLCLVTVLFAFSCFPRGGQGADLNLLLNGKAFHINASDGADYNENNWGAGLQYDFDRKGNWIPFINISGFLDSNENTSWYAGGGSVYRFELGTDGGLHAELGAIAFVMRRKGFRNDRPFPGVLPVASVGSERLALNITYIPKIDPKMVPLVFLQLKLKLGAQSGS
jgi:hypothetical protein